MTSAVRNAFGGSNPDEEATKLDALPPGSIPHPDSERVAVAALTNHGVVEGLDTHHDVEDLDTQHDLEGLDTHHDNMPFESRGAFADLDDERTTEYAIQPSPTLVDIDDERTADADLDMGAPASLVRCTVLPRSRAEVGRHQSFLGGGPRFEGKGRLGGGVSGHVTLEFDRDIERPVAVKRLVSDEPEMVMRFAEEVRTVGGLEHPNIVPIHDVGVDERKRYYFVMKYLDGDTLEKIIKKLSAGDPEYLDRYTAERRADICMEVMQALAYAHARGVVHRDIKPANIMVGRFGEVMLMDWGVAKRIRGAPEGAEERPPTQQEIEPETDEARVFATQNGALIGTPYYMSPEQARADNAKVDERSDVYCLSVVIHELFTLQHYLSGRNSLLSVLDGITAPDRPFTAFVQDIYQCTLPCEVMHFVRKGMRKDPAERYQSMDEMIRAFERARAGRFKIQCYFTFMKRCARALAHVVDKHPILVTVAFAAWVVSVPWLLIVVAWKHL